jgi:hypothetical protein
MTPKITRLPRGAAINTKNTLSIAGVFNHNPTRIATSHAATRGTSLSVYLQTVAIN